MKESLNQSDEGTTVAWLKHVAAVGHVALLPTPLSKSPRSIETVKLPIPKSRIKKWSRKTDNAVLINQGRKLHKGCKATSMSTQVVTRLGPQNR